MQGWQITKAGVLENVTKVEPLTDVDSVKVRVMKTLVTCEDVVTFLGEDKKVKFPVVPCTSAIGQINELPIESPYLEKGTRVYVSSVKNCDKCPHCVTGSPENCYDFSIAGKNRDGFLKDFALVDASDVFPLPPSIRDEDAVYIELIKLALSVIDQLSIEKGQHVAIIGATVLGTILAQLIIYYQGVPILIDSSDEKLELAKRSGVYYVVNSEHGPEKEVAAITGGRMALKVVHESRSGMPFDLAIKLAAPTASVAFVGFSFPNVRLSLQTAFEKRVNCFGVTNGYGNCESAINMLANKAVDLSNYDIPVVPIRDAETTFSQMAETFKEHKTVSPVIINTLE